MNTNADIHIIFFISLSDCLKWKCFFIRYTLNTSVCVCVCESEWGVCVCVDCLRGGDAEQRSPSSLEPGASLVHDSLPKQLI